MTLDAFDRVCLFQAAVSTLALAFLVWAVGVLFRDRPRKED